MASEETSCVGDAPLSMPIANCGQKIRVAKSKTLLILSLKSEGAKRENRLRHPYRIGEYYLLDVE